ncbi:MAG: hypothetical protein V1886_01350 [archaeon]
MGTKRFLRKMNEFWKLADISDIARRYFAMNIFDDVLMVLGILLAGFFSKAGAEFITTAVTGAAVAVTVSGTWGAYIAESSERKGKIKSLERKMAINLRKSPIEKAHNFATLFLSLVNGLPSIIVAMFIILPFILKMGIMLSYSIAFALSFFVLFWIGAFLGRLGKENLILSGAKMILVGIICSIIIFLVERAGASA